MASPFWREMEGSGYEPPCGTAPRWASAEDRQAGISHYCLHTPTQLRGSLLAHHRQTPASEQSLRLDPVLAFWAISVLAFPKCQGTEVTFRIPAPQLLIQYQRLHPHYPHRNPMSTQQLQSNILTPCFPGHPYVRHPLPLSEKPLLEGLLSLLDLQGEERQNKHQEHAVTASQLGRGVVVERRQPGHPITSAAYSCEIFLQEITYPNATWDEAFEVILPALVCHLL